MFDAAEAAFGGVDVLVNNAGIMALSSLADTDDVAFERQVNVNLRAPSTRCAKLRSGCATAGRIINFSSSVVGLLQPTYGVYAGTRAAVEAMTSILAKKLRGRSSKGWRVPVRNGSGPRFTLTKGPRRNSRPPAVKRKPLSPCSATRRPLRL